MNFRKFISGSILSIIFLLFFIYGISGVSWIFSNIKNKTVIGSMVNVLTDTAIQQVALKSEAPLPEFQINAESVISIRSDLNDSQNIVFSKNIDKILPIASLTKLMTAVVVLDNYNLSDIITIDEIADSQDPMKQDVSLGDNLTIGNLLDLMLIRSSNKAAFALSEGPENGLGKQIMGQNFIGLMNIKAREIGMKNTFFSDPTGISPNNISTVNDLSILAKYILKNKKYSRIAEISKTKQINIPGLGEVSNTNELLGEIPDVVCGKTGFTTLAKGCLLLVVNNPKNNDYLINVILGSDDRFTEMKKIINWSSAMCN